MKKITFAAFFVFIALLAKSQTKNFIDQPYIEVTGNADTLITPDEIFIKIVISEADTKGRISVEDLESKMVDSLKSSGIETEKNLTTSDMSSNFKYYFLRSKDILKTKEYILKVKDAVTASKVFILLEDLGISNTSIDRVDYSELENLKNLLRTKAVENAKTHAIALIKPLNQTLGAAIYVADIVGTDVSNSYNNDLNEVVITGYGLNGNAQSVLPKIEFQKIKVSANVNVKFILK